MKIVYNFSMKKEREHLCCSSLQFPEICGIGIDKQDAFLSLITQIEAQLKENIKNGLTVPLGEDVYLQKNSDGIFTLPLSMQFSLYLYSAMLDKDISKDTLAQLLALDEIDVQNNEWDFEKISKIKSRNNPKYAEVEKLLDIAYDSTINEMAEAFRVLGFDVSLTIEDRS